MTGSRPGGNAHSMSRDDFNARAKALSARLGPIEQGEVRQRKNAPPRRPPAERQATEPSPAPAGQEQAKGEG